MVALLLAALVTPCSAKTPSTHLHKLFTTITDTTSGPTQLEVKGEIPAYVQVE